MKGCHGLLFRPARLSALLEWPRVWSQENLYLPEPDGLFVPWLFCWPVSFFCIRRVLPRENKLIIDVWFKRNNASVHGQVWRQDGVCPPCSLPPPRHGVCPAPLPPAAPTHLRGGVPPCPLRCWRSSLGAQGRMWVMRRCRSIWGNPRAFWPGCVLPCLSVTDGASSPRFLRSFGSVRLQRTGVGSPCVRFAVRPDARP